MAKADAAATEPATADVARGYFDSVAARNPDAIAARYAPGSIDRLVGMAELRAPDEVREWFTTLFAAIPDFSFEVLDLAADGDKAAVRWRSRGTFDGPPAGSVADRAMLAATNARIAAVDRVRSILGR